MQTRNILLVVLWMIGTLLSFSAMAISIRLLAGQLTIFEILTVRSAGALVILGALLAFNPSLRPHLPSRRLPMHAFRSAVHFAGQYAWATSLTLLPFATVFAIELTLPVWVLLLAVLILGEKLTRGRIMVLVLGFIGCLVILRPGLQAFQPAALLVLLSSVCYAVFNIATKQMTSTESTFGIVFWMNLMQFPLGLAGSDPFFALRFEAWHVWPVVGIAVSGLAAHYCMANAFRHGDASLVVPIDFLRVPLIAIVGWLFFNEPLDALVLIGAFIILVGILWNLRAEARLPPLPEDQGLPEER